MKLYWLFLIVLIMPIHSIIAQANQDVITNAFLVRTPDKNVLIDAGLGQKLCGLRSKKQNSGRRHAHHFPCNRPYKSRSGRL